MFQLWFTKKLPLQMEKTKTGVLRQVGKGTGEGVQAHNWDLGSICISWERKDLLELFLMDPTEKIKDVRENIHPLKSYVFLRLETKIA